MLKKFYRLIIIPYTVFLLYLMFLGMGRFQYEDNIARLVPVYATVKFIELTISWLYITEIILGNIVMFIPFGFLGWLFPKLKDMKSLLFAFISAITIVEALQYFTRMGIFETDDIILNTLGVYLGWGLCRFMEAKSGR
ncbi:VanZ family protein [Chryseobacterium gossypii]|uniref:VanZ family protein n=1 Tax=Chryseobacterium gossypii TaxID=3231602 RepID=UPI00352495E6